jgi:hypothetical protein
MKTLELALVFLLISAAGCGTVRNDAGPPTDASELFAYAINNQNIAATVSRDEIRENYEHMFEEDHIPILKIRVDGFDQSGDIAHEWGSFKIGNSVGCYVLLRRAIDNWKIHREWIVEPCGH